MILSFLAGQTLHIQHVVCLYVVVVFLSSFLSNENIKIFLETIYNGQLEIFCSEKKSIANFWRKKLRFRGGWFRLREDQMRLFLRRET